MKDYSRDELEYGIDKWIVGKNGERNRIILKLKLIDGLSYVEIAERLSLDDSLPPRYKLSVRQLQRVVPKIQMTLFSHI